MTEEIDILLARYFGGEASEQELRLLDEWLSQSKENEAYFLETTLTFQHSAMLTPMPEPNTNKAFENFETHIAQQNNSQTAHKTFWQSGKFLLSIAASVALLVAVFILLPTNNTPQNQVMLTAEGNTLQQTIFPNVEVELTQGSELSYNPSNKKEIILQRGEATFSVNSSDDSEKLRVQVGAVVIEDIGTVFTISAHNPLDSIVVEVVDGEILFHTATQTYRVKASERGVYYPQKDYFELVSKVKNLQAIEFRAMPLEQVTAMLAKQFDASISINSEDLRNLPISVTFDPNETIETILFIVSETLSLRVIEKSKNEYVLLEQ